VDNPSLGDAAKPKKEDLQGSRWTARRIQTG
jgi:hypothetical protein